MSATILVVDDEESIRKLYQLELMDEGYNVILAADGQEALQKVERENPDLVILDIRMPKVDGIEFLDRFAQTGKRLPIIINSAYTDYRMDITTWAAETYMVKSSDISDLKAEVKKLLAGKSSTFVNPKSI
ncbi:TPA: response regulator [Candidatus Poribacteria bacterium]|nr:response regulator [Candidatus Poribacteria bacterium]